MCSLANLSADVFCVGRHISRRVGECKHAHKPHQSAPICRSDLRPTNQPEYISFDSNRKLFDFVAELSRTGDGSRFEVSRT